MSSTTKQFIKNAIKHAQIKEYLYEKLKDAGFTNADIIPFAAGLRIMLDVERPKVALGLHGLKIKEIEEELKSKFDLKNVEIFINEIKDSFLNPLIVAQRIASAMERGIHFRRIANIVLKQIMEAGARGAEIVISGKLVSERARYEKFRFGVLPKSGEPAAKYVKEAKIQVLLKPGTYGIIVKILPPIFLPDDKLNYLKQKYAAKLKEITE